MFSRPNNKIHVIHVYVIIAFGHVYRQENAKRKMILKKNLRSTFLNIGKYPNLKVKRIFSLV